MRAYIPIREPWSSQIQGILIEHEARTEENQSSKDPKTKLDFPVAGFGGGRAPAPLLVAAAGI